ncbi:MAG: hypothetical protein SFX73_02250 [Kofleriaceae bacterium]|nr:hypothetical protein [Kofleriaceae bacterium]
MTLLIWTAVVGVGLLSLGLSAVTLAQRNREPCTACRKAHVEIQRDFTMRCVACGARFERGPDGLRPVDRQG